MTWRVARALEQLRDQANRFAPNRSKASDGTIGDAAHAATTSDHNPWVKDGKMGVVTALDLTHDPRPGVDTYLMAELLRQNRDNRIKYVISNRRIFSATVSPWTWRAYTGSNPHSSHIHVSVVSTKSLYDNTRSWEVFAPGEATDQRPILRRGSRGVHVVELQGLLHVAPDGEFGPETERVVIAFQRATMGLDPDGVVGPATWAALDPIKEGQPNPDAPDARPILRRGVKGEHVRIVQRLLMLQSIDGDFGPATDREVIAFQTAAKLTADGVVGPATWAALDGIEQLPRPLNFDEPMELSEPEEDPFAP